jgi:aspartate racemase
VRLAAAEHLLLATLHHIVTDGWSAGLFMGELLVLDEAFAAGRPSPLPELPLQYPDFAVWQRRSLTGEALDHQLAAWKSRFGDDLPVLRLPTDRPRPAARTFRGNTLSRPLPAALTAAVRALGARCGATPFMTLLAAFQALLHAYTSQDVVVLGTPTAGRGRAELEGMIGFFVNTVVLRGDLSGDPSFQDLLHRTRDMALGAFACQDLPFETLVEALHKDRDRSRSPLFQVMFALNSTPPSVAPGPLAAAPYLSENGTSQFDLTLYIEDGPAGLTAEVEHNTDLFDAATMERLLDHYQDLLARVTGDPGLRLSALAVPPLVAHAVPAEEPAAAAPAGESAEARRARLAARRAHLPAAKREALGKRLRGEGDDAR